MNRQELEQSWAVTRRHLDRAGGMISSLPEAAARLTQFAEYLAHNELELALDELSEAGEALEEGDAFHCPGQFWDELVCAARNMNQEKKAERFRNRQRERR